SGPVFRAGLTSANDRSDPLRSSIDLAVHKSPMLTRPIFSLDCRSRSRSLQPYTGSCEQRFVAEGQEGAAQCGKYLELVVRPLNRSDGVAQRHDLFAIVERTAADQDVGYAPRLKRAHVWPRNVGADIAEAAEENGDVPRPDWDRAALLFDRPAALVDQPVDEGANGAWQGFVDARIDDLAEIAIRLRGRE